MYNEAKLKYGSIRGAAKALGLTKSKFTTLWKKELGVCNRGTRCMNIPNPGTTYCEECKVKLISSQSKSVKRKEYMKEFGKVNRKLLSENNKKYYYKNHKKQREYYNNYYRTVGKKAANAQAASYRASKRNATPKWVSRSELRDVFKSCPDKSHVDHIIPLKHPQVCGLHVPWNLQILTAYENDSKSNSFDFTYDNDGWRRKTCHQYLRRLQTENEDRDTGMPFDLRVDQFTTQNEPMSKDIRDFIAKYEWLGNIGWSVKWCFTARYEGKLAGVVLLSEPTQYSKLNELVPNGECLIQRGAGSSWAPKGLNSRLVMFACNWMVKNTNKRLFVAYSDPTAGEIGTIYQACNFSYLGTDYGSKIEFTLPNGKTVSDRYFSRTSAMKKWAKELGIKWEDSWNKANKYQDLSKIPEDIKTRLKLHAKSKMESCPKKKSTKKGKYLLILGKDRREQKQLNKLKDQIKTKKYPKRST